MPKGRRSKKQNKTKLNIQVAVLMLASVLLAVLIYTKSGYIGETLSPILGGIMGWIKYIIPVGTFAMAIFIAKEEEQTDFSKKIMQYAILLLCISAVITIIHAHRGEIYLDGKLDDIIEQAYYQGTRNEGGGAVGTAFAYGLTKLLGKLGAVITAIGIALIDSIFLFGLEPAKLVQDYLQNRKDRKDNNYKL